MNQAPEGVVFRPAPAECSGEAATFTEGYLGRKPQIEIYDLDYFRGSQGLLPKDGSFLNPESAYQNKAKDILKWIEHYVPAGKILDVGAGPGHIAYWAEKQAMPLSVVSCDVSEAILTSEYNQNPQASVVSTVHELPFRDQAFEGVLFSDILEHIWPDQAVKAVQNAHRILKDGGYVFVNIPNREAWTDAAAHHEGHVWLPTLDEVVRLLELGGFQNQVQYYTRGFKNSAQFKQEHGHDLGQPSDGTSIFACVRK